MVASTDVLWVDVGFDKLQVRTKESAHVAFPINVPGGVMRVDQGEAIVEIDGTSCRDRAVTSSACTAARCVESVLGLSFVSLDAPLIDLGR